MQFTITGDNNIPKRIHKILKNDKKVNLDAEIFASQKFHTPRFSRGIS